MFEGTLRVTDLDSTNGTFCAELAIRDAFLRGGESLQIGQTRLRIDRSTTSVTSAPSQRTRLGRVVGGSPAMRRLYPLVERLAASDIPLVIEGETGTGKEALAEQDETERHGRDSGDAAASTADDVRSKCSDPNGT